MSFYVQLKDDVCFAYVESQQPVDNSILLEDGIDPNSILAHTLVDGKWVPAELIYFVEKINSDGIVEKVNSTVYLSDVTGEIVPNYVNFGWKKENGEWVNYLELQQQKHKEEQDKINLENAILQALNSRPFPSWNWVNNEWTAPQPAPEGDPNDYYWDEETLSWQPYIDANEQSNEINN